MTCQYIYENEVEKYKAMGFKVVFLKESGYYIGSKMYVAVKEVVKEPEDNKVRVSELFSITVGSEDCNSYIFFKAPSELTEIQYRKLVDKIKNEEWNKIKKNNKKGYITADYLLVKIVNRLKKNYWFTEIQPIDYYIAEFDYIDDKSENVND